MVYKPKKRTNQQNRSLHKFCSLLSDQLNTLGLEMKVVLKPDYQIWWTPEAVKEHLWRPIQKAKFQKESTTELSKLGEIDQIHEDLMRILGEKYGEVGFDYIPFPHNEINETNYNLEAEKLRRERENGK